MKGEVMSDLNDILVASRWEEQPGAFIASTQLDRLYGNTLTRLTEAPSGLSVARELAADYLPADGSGFSGSHMEGSDLPKDYWPRVALQYGAQAHLWSQCVAGKLSLYVRGDKSYFQAPHDDLVEIPDALNWETTLSTGRLMGGTFAPFGWRRVHLLRPQVWVSDIEAQAALRALETESETPEELRGLSPQQLGGKMRGAKRTAKADLWRIPAVERARYLTERHAHHLPDGDLIHRVYDHLSVRVFRENPSDCPAFKTVDNYLRRWLKAQRSAASK